MDECKYYLHSYIDSMQEADVDYMQEADDSDHDTEIENKKSEYEILCEKNRTEVKKMLNDIIKEVSTMYVIAFTNGSSVLIYMFVVFCV